MLRFVPLTKTLTCRKGILKLGISMQLCSVRLSMPLQNQAHLSFRCMSSAPQQKNLSSETPKEDIDLTNFVIPDPPVYKPPPFHLDGYPSSSDVNITWWLPTGWVYHSLMTLEQYTQWTITIPTITFVARLLLIPFMISQQKFNIKLNNINPYLKLYSKKIREAQQCGNHMEEAKFYGKMGALYKDSGLKQTRTFVNSAVQGTVFASFFLTLRALSNAPLFSLTYEGLPWCPDFTQSDPTYILNVSTCVSLAIVLKLGVDFAIQTTSGLTRLWQKVFVFGPPIIIFIFTNFLPATLAYYWTCNNIISIIQTLILRSKSIRQLLKLPHKEVPDIISDESKEDSFFTYIKKNFKEKRLLSKADINVRSRHQRFLKAGMGPIIKTYEYDPTKE